MRKLLAFFLTVVMLLPCVALSEEAPVADVTANAVIKSENTYDLTAPYTGVLLPFVWSQGDSVKMGDTLFAMDTMKIYAPTDGTLQGVFAKRGELCEDAISQYGSIAIIEKEPSRRIDASTTGAYNDVENKLIHVGEHVYFQQSKDKDNTGEGFVISVNLDKYEVEVMSGNFDVDDEVKIFREEKMGTKTAIGQGTILRAKDVTVVGSGRVLNVAVEAGQKVKKGQLLFELVAADAAPTTISAQVLAMLDGALGEPQVRSGGQVYKGQVLVTLHDLSTLKMVAEVDEMDLSRVNIGDSLNVVLDRYPSEKLQGTVRKISRIGVKKQNATYYDVELAFSTGLEVLPSMNATVWLPNKP